MVHASTVMASPAIRMPSVAMPKLRWPLLSPRARALLMMAVMASPCVLCDAIGYCVQRLAYTSDEIADRRAPDRILAQISIFQVACPSTDMPAGEQRRWAAEAAQHGWPLYREAGAGCFKSGRNLLGVVGLKVFSVACPVMALSPADQRRWVAFSANHGWTAYPQAGEGCVDP
jgi:hypothetical protein